MADNRAPAPAKTFRSGKQCIDANPVPASLLHTVNKTSSRPGYAPKWLALLCAVNVWLVGLLAASPTLHSALHADANHGEHTCAVTLFSHGIEDGSADTALLVAPLFFATDEASIQPAKPVAEPLHRLPPGRGPPSC